MILIYGLGGSGTRLYIDILRIYGIYVGNNLNESLDDLNTFFYSDYYDQINNKLSFDDYNNFKQIFYSQLNSSGYLDKDIFCIKEPNFHILIHLVIKFCKEYNINLITIHTIRDFKYMINSLNKNQPERWKSLFINKYNEKYKKTRFQSIEYWYYANRRAINFVKENNIKHLILSYENLINHPEIEISKIFKLINKNFDISKYDDFVSKISNKSRSKEEKIEYIPNDLIVMADKINKKIN